MSQTYATHQRMVPMYHYVLLLLSLATFIGSLVNLYSQVDDLYSASLIASLSFCLVLAAYYARVFSLKAQDRAIRAEENLRTFARTGKLLNPALTMRQIIGLRFASDEEFDALAARAVSEGMSEKDIKKAIKNWKADEYRV